MLRNPAMAQAINVNMLDEIVDFEALGKRACGLAYRPRWTDIALQSVTTRAIADGVRTANIPFVRRALPLAHWLQC